SPRLARRARPPARRLRPLRPGRLRRRSRRRHRRRRRRRLRSHHAGPRLRRHPRRRPRRLRPRRRAVAPLLICGSRAAGRYRADVREVLGIARDLTTILGTFLARAVRRRELPLQELAKDLEDALPAGIFSLAHYERWLTRSFEKQRVPLRFADIPRELYVTA